MLPKRPRVTLEKADAIQHTYGFPHPVPDSALRSCFGLERHMAIVIDWRRSAW